MVYWSDPLLKVHLCTENLFHSNRCSSAKSRTSAGILEQSMGARNRDVVPARHASQAGVIDFLESIPGLLKSLKIQFYIARP
jgi:hypothetical protein